MAKNYSFELQITFSDGGVSAIDVINLYGNQVRDDIDQLAWNLCDCDDNFQKDRFGALKLVRWNILPNKGDKIHVSSEFTVNAQNVEFINQVVEEFMNGFADYIAATVNGLYSRTGERVGFNPQPLDWDVEINRN